MNVFLNYLQQNRLDIRRMTAEEIIAAFDDSGSTRSADLSELIAQMPQLVKLKVLYARLEQVLDDDEHVGGSHVGDNDLSHKGYKSLG